MKLKYLILAFPLFCLSVAAHAQGSNTPATPNVQHDNDGDMRIDSPEGTLKVDNDGDTRLKMRDGRKIKVDKDGDVKKKPRRAWERAERAQADRRQGPPSWAPAHGYRNDRHVYFQDYHTFYDPNRGYVYWQDGQWISSTTSPTFLNGVDLNTARVQVLQDVDLNTRPELQYRTYRNQFPARRVEVTIPIPE